MTGPCLPSMMNNHGVLGPPLSIPYVHECRSARDGGIVIHIFAWATIGELSTLLCSIVPFAVGHIHRNSCIAQPSVAEGVRSAAGKRRGARNLPRIATTLATHVVVVCMCTPSCIRTHPPCQDSSLSRPTNDEEAHA